MVKLSFSYQSELEEYDHVLRMKDMVLWQNKGVISTNQVVDLECEIEDTIIVKLENKLIVEKAEEKNIWQKILSVIVTFLCNSFSILDYNVDCSEYYTDIILKITGENPTLSFHLFKNSNDCTDIVLSGTNVEIIKSTTNKQYNKTYLLESFSEFHKFNIWKTSIFSLLLLPLIVIGIFRKIITTVVFSGLLLLFVWVAACYTRHNLKKMLKKHFE